MDMNEFGPAPGRSGLPQRDELTEAVKQLARERTPSTSRLAGTFSAPQQYNHDVHFTQAQQQAEARRAARPSQMQPLQFGGQERVQRIQNAAEKLNPARPQTNVYVQQERQAPAPQPQTGTQGETPQPRPQAPAGATKGDYEIAARTPVGQTGTQLPAPQPQAPQTQARGRVFERQPGDTASPYGNPADRIARDVAAGVVGRYDGSSIGGSDPYSGVRDMIAKPPVASTTPVPGSQVGRFGDVVPKGYAPGGQPYGENPYQAVNDRIENAGRFARYDQAQKDRAAASQDEDQWVETPSPEFEDTLRRVAHANTSPGNELRHRRIDQPDFVINALGRASNRSVSEQPEEGTVLGGQFGKGGSQYQASRDDLGWQMTHGIADEMTGPAVRRVAEDLPEAL